MQWHTRSIKKQDQHKAGLEDGLWPPFAAHFVFRTRVNFINLLCLKSASSGDRDITVCCIVSH